MNLSDKLMSANYMSIEDFLRKISLPKRYFGGDFVIAEKYEEERRHSLKALSNAMAANSQNLIIKKLWLFC